MSVACKHGQLARSCDICDLERELTAARAEVARLTQERDTLAQSLRDMLDAAESAGWGNAEVHNAREALAGLKGSHPAPKGTP
jgi:hypothetical protein